MRVKGNRWGDADILVVGAGVLGVAVSYWLSKLYDCSILLVDMEGEAGAHTSSRNTGVIHRPFYLNPESKKVFARSSLLSYPLWEGLARDLGLPWSRVGTLNVAVSEEEVATLEQYRNWGERNGMEHDELELLDGRAVKGREPQVECRAGLLSRTDVSVDFGEFTRVLHLLAIRNGVEFVGGLTAASVSREGDMISVAFAENEQLEGIRCRFMVNAAGGGALRIAHRCGLAKEYASLNFRGEYWIVDEPFASKVGTNIYRPPRYPQFPFLDPHFVVRSDGSRQIGPNAAMVTGPYVYHGVGWSLGEIIEGPVGPKFKLLSNPTFLSMAAKEWRNSISKRAMCERVEIFIPGLDANMLGKRGISGIRTSVVGSTGFVPEAVLAKGANSAHILNYNSPGATGAPAYSAMVVANLREEGLLEGFRVRKDAKSEHGWDFERVAEPL
jgi:L-2-hydroxyglutarate oxidase